MTKSHIRVDERRTRPLNTQPVTQGPVVYWMSRDQRAQDNWALLYAAQEAEKRAAPLLVIFALTPHFPEATLRHYDFMLRGLEDVSQDLQKHHIPFYVIKGQIVESVTTFVKEHKAGLLVTDFSPVKIGREWREKVSESVKIKVVEVDTHNIVPCWVASPKQEFSARTLRPKLHWLLPDFLSEFPTLPSFSGHQIQDLPTFQAAQMMSTLKFDVSVKTVTWLKPGQYAAHQVLDSFIQERLSSYATSRNDPNRHSQSELSPYLHFGQLSPQRVALEVERSTAPAPQQEAFLEEVIVRRELSDNFCFYNPAYDSVSGFPNWAKKTLEVHKNDPRENIYSLRELEAAQTHDELWNAAQLEMVKRGKMHGYLRMYWAKKILEWSPNPATAMKTAIFLNDRYQLDGRDPNGYTGIAWSIGGVHDRPWFDRPIFGQVRYMNYSGASRKFSIPEYISYVKSL